MRVIYYQCTEWLWKIVLLTLAASRGVTDLYPISFIRIKHRTRANDILCKTEHQQSYRTFSPQKPYYTNVSDVPRSLQSWVSPIQTVVLTADVFQLFIKWITDTWPGFSRWLVRGRADVLLLSRRISELASSLAAEKIRKLPISHPIPTSSPVTAALQNCESPASRIAVPSRLQRNLLPGRTI